MTIIYSHSRNFKYEQMSKLKSSIISHPEEVTSSWIPINVVSGHLKLSQKIQFIVLSNLNCFLNNGSVHTSCIVQLENIYLKPAKHHNNLADFLVLRNIQTYHYYSLIFYHIQLIVHLYMCAHTYLQQRPHVKVERNLTVSVLSGPHVHSRDPAQALRLGCRNH